MSAMTQDATTVDETTEQTESVTGSDVYLLKDSSLEDDEQGVSDSLDGSDEAESAEPAEPLADSVRLQRRHGLVVALAAVVGVFVVAGVIVVVALSVASLVDQSAVPAGSDSRVTDSEQLLTSVPAPSLSPVPQPVVNLTWSDNCVTSIFGEIDNGVRVFKGLRYAAAPVNELRWREPVLYSPSGSDCPVPIDARVFGKKCAQLTSRVDGSDEGLTVIGGEDCLFINVWSPIDAPVQADPAAMSPPSAAAAAGLEVMVYMHDGGLVTGSGHEPDGLPDADLVRDSNVVVVSFNYRLNIFGFLALQQLTATDAHNSSGYYGMLDQITALRWVQKHISAFGGDPNKVTVFGHGSGATSIYMLLACDMCRGLFSRAWLSNPSPRFEHQRVDAEQQNIDILNSTGCSINYTHPQQVCSCLRSLSTKSLLYSMPWTSWLNEHLYGIPTVDETSVIIATVDGYIVKNSTLKSWEQKRFSDVPLLISSAAQLSDIMLTPGHLDTWMVNNYITQRLMPFVDELDVNINDVFLLYTPVGSDIDTPGDDVSAEWRITTLVSDMRATCPLDEMARVAAFNSISPVYRYQVQYQQTGTQLPSGMNYAYRGIDVDAFLRSQSPISSASDWLPLVTTVRRLVTQFVKNATVDGWLTFPQATYTVIGTSFNATSPYVRTKRCDYWRIHGFYPRYTWIN